MDKLFSEITAADQKQIGFLYQDYVCISYLLDLQQGEVVGLEVLDDVHHERIEGKKELIQVKHSVSQDKSLTNNDIDFWKTIYNWMNVLPEAGNKEVAFIFYTNKSPTERLGIINQIINDPNDATKIDHEIAKIHDELNRKASTKGDKEPENPIKKYVDYVYSQPSEIRRIVLSRIRFIFDSDNIFEVLRKKIEFFGVRESDSKDVLIAVIGMFTTKKYELVKDKKKFIITYEQFRNDFQFNRTLELARSRDIKFQRYQSFKTANKIDPNNGLFSKQLQDIGIGKDEIREYSIEYAATEMFLEQLKSKGDYTDYEEDIFDGELIHGWKNCYLKAYDEEIPDENFHNKVARSILRTTIGIDITVSLQKVTKGLVEGKAIGLSDKSKIGWRKDWKIKYGNKE